MTRRVVFVLLSVTVVVLVALEVPLAVSLTDQRRRDLQTELERDALTVADVVELDIDPPNRQRLAAVVRAYQRERGGRALVVDAAGTALADSDPTEEVGSSVGRSFASRPEISSALAGRTSVVTRASATLGTSVVSASAPVRLGAQVVGAVRVTRSRAEVDREVSDYQRSLLAIGLATLAVAAGLGIAVGRWATKPLATLQAAAARLGAGELDARAPDDQGPPEVQDLAARFNAMADRLASLIESSQQLAADASHQLRTPLTAMRLRLDNLAEDETTGEQVGPVLDELERLERTVDGLLALTRVEQQEPHLVEVPVAAVLQSRATTWAPAAEESGVTLRVDADAALTVRFDANHLDQVLDNLIANALDVAPRGSVIELHGVSAGDAVELHVTDHGPGLSAEDRMRALDRQWSRRPGGTGLGLAIVQRLCAHNRGSVRLDESEGGGVDAVVTAPGGARSS